MGAETLEAAKRDDPGLRHASMRPRHDGRGNNDVQTKAAVVPKLQ